MKVTMVIAIKDEKDLPSGHKRKKAGDIIAVCPFDHIGGVMTRKTHLLVKVDLGDSVKTLEEAKKLMMPHCAEGDAKDLTYENMTILGKRRYKIPINELLTKASLIGKTVDMVKVLDEKLDYQPLEAVTLPLTDLIYDKFAGEKVIKIIPIN